MADRIPRNNFQGDPGQELFAIGDVCLYDPITLSDGDRLAWSTADQKWCALTPPNGDVTGAANVTDVGDSEGVFRDEVAGILNFKSIAPGVAIDVNTVGNDVKIDVDLGTGASQAAAGNHKHDAADVISGTFADARISASSVQQHPATDLKTLTGVISVDSTDPPADGAILQRTAAGVASWVRGVASTTNSTTAGKSITVYNDATGTAVDVLQTAAGAGEIIYSDGASTFDTLAAGTSGQVLRSNGAAAPSWADPSTVSGVTIANVTDSTGVGIFRDETPAGTFNLHSLLGGVALKVIDTGNDLTLDVQLGTAANQAAAGNHTHTLVDITDSGTAAARDIGSASGEIQQNGLALVASSIVETDGSSRFITAAKATGYNKAFGTSAGTVAEGNHTHDASDIVSGTFADARISASNVQQHPATDLKTLTGSISVNTTDPPADGAILQRTAAGVASWVRGVASQNNSTTANKSIVVYSDATGTAIDVLQTAAGAGEIIYSDGASTFDTLAAGTAGYFLSSNGAAAPSWVDPATTVKRRFFLDGLIKDGTSNNEVEWVPASADLSPADYASWVMPKAVNLISITAVICHNAAWTISAGTMSFAIGTTSGTHTAANWTQTGAVCGTLTSADGANPRLQVTGITRAFSAGDRVVVRVTTDAGFSATSPNADIQVLCEFEEA